MLTSEILHILIPFLTSLLLGVVYFVTLNVTVRAVMKTQNLWLLPISFLVRMALLVGGIYFVCDGHWERIAVCLLGVVLARTVVIWAMTFQPKKA